MSMKPILFNTEMVKAIQVGRKTVTRRIIKPQPSETAEMRHVIAGGRKGDIGKWKDWSGSVFSAQSWNPPYHAGDILYVRESWRVRNVFGDFSRGDRTAEIEFKAAGPRVFIRGITEEFEEKWRPGTGWHSSIHMPKEAARIFLRVKSVSVERLQAITNKEAIREGFDGVPCDCANKDEHGCVDCLNTGWIEPPAMYFIDLCDSTIKPADLDKYGWDANPWVWVIEFERCEKPKEDQK